LKINALLGFISLSTVLILFNHGSILANGSNTTAINGNNTTAINGNNTTAVNLDDAQLKMLLADYVNWDTSLPDAKMPTPQSTPPQSTVNQCVIKSGPVVYLVDPFSRGKFNQICEIKSESSLLFPFFIGFCDNGGAGNYGEQSFQKISDCAMDSDKGIVTMEGWVDGNKIIDIKVDNKDFHNPIKIYDKFPGNNYYKVIKTDNFFNNTAKSDSHLAGSYKEGVLSSSPAIFKGAGHCFCGLVPNLSPGSHEVRYKTTIEGTGGMSVGGYDQMTDVTYKINVK